jgi:hypothetical protein
MRTDSGGTYLALTMTELEIGSVAVTQLQGPLGSCWRLRGTAGIQNEPQNPSVSGDTLSERIDIRSADGTGGLDCRNVIYA